MEMCKECGNDIQADDQGTWLDETGSDVCGWNGGNEPHEPTPDTVDCSRCGRPVEYAYGVTTCENCHADDVTDYRANSYDYNHTT
jgi:hypothetical protein